MAELVKEYHQLVNDAQKQFKNKLKELYPTIYMVKLDVDSPYVVRHEFIACFSKESDAMSLIGSGEWSTYDERHYFTIIPITNYDNIDIELLLNINNNIDMSWFGKMYVPNLGG